MESDLELEHLSESRFGSVFRRQHNQPRLISVERVSALSVQEFHASFASEGLPVVVESLGPSGLTDPREANRILAATIGTERVTVRYGGYADPDNYVAHRMRRTLTVSEFLADLDVEGESAAHCYLANHELPPEATKVLGLHPPPYYQEVDLRPPRMWLGPAGCITPLHKDGSDNFSLQVFGTKRWLIFPVRDYPFLYLRQPQPDSFPGFSCSTVDIRQPDHRRFPLFRHARALEVEVNAGDALYLPAGWSHYVETLSKSLMVNYWLSTKRLPACLEPLPGPLF